MDFNTGLFRRPTKVDPLLMSGSTFVGLRNRPVLKSICAYIE